MEKAATYYETCLLQAASYLESRGITLETAKTHRLGVVGSEDHGHERDQGRLSIPYLDRIGVYGFKFRCLLAHDCKEAGCPKYTNPAGQELSLYNVLALDSDSETLHITEGELDAIVLSSIIAGPVVAIPGASLWKKHFPFHLAGFTRVLVWADGDEPGTKMAARIADTCAQAEVFQMPSGEDVNSMFLKNGPDYFLQLAFAEV